jgi:hypothetical protein
MLHLVTSSYDLDDIIHAYETYNDMTFNDDKTLSVRLYLISDMITTSGRDPAD